MLKQKSVRGFTLLELLVVIAIIGLLSTFAVVSLNSGRLKARDSKRLTDMKSLQTAMEFYYDDNGDYGVGSTDPAAVSGLPLSTYIPQVSQMEDPSGATALCSATSVAVCDYAFVNSSTSTYTVHFYLEGATSVGNTAADACTLTPSGISCP
ncbi:MAG: type II secretion system protein [Candidatus Komeilibacteria bacterium]